MKEMLVGIGISVGIFLVVMLVTIISGCMKSIMEAKKQEALANSNIAQANAWDTAIKVVDAVTTATVSTIEQTTAKDLREAVKDGKADRQELINLSYKAYNSILEQIKPEIIQTLKENVTDYQSYLENRIEQAVLEVKK